MPRRSRELILAASRAAEARRLVAGPGLLVETLQASGKPLLDALDVLKMCISALEVLEGHEHRLVKERRAKGREARSKVNGTGYSTPDHWQFGISQPVDEAAAAHFQP